MDEDECVEILRLYRVALPKAFLKAAFDCFPDDVPRSLRELAAYELHLRPSSLIRLDATYAEVTALAELAPLVWWECGQDPSGAPASLASAAEHAVRAISQARPVERWPSPL
ncbi:hypothetical protein [Kitasatospora sp. NPDC048407]|uniref:hypothetical protein n=1 Tax=Kitasatospora sp. NPDC048407 TaxID=3364051 RepID=UPI003723E553